MIIDDAVAAYIAHRRELRLVRPLTLASEASMLGGFAKHIGPVSVKAITRDHIEAYLGSIRDLAPGTRRTRFSALRCFCRWLVERGYLRADPTLGVPTPKVPRSVHRALDHDQSAALLAACRTATERLVIVLALQLGLRRAEIAGLEVGDLRTVDNLVIIRHGKGGHERMVPLTAEARAAVIAYRQEVNVTAGPLLRLYARPRDGVSPSWVGRLVTNVAFRAGIKHHPGDGVSTHALRHSAASDVYRACRDVMIVRDMLGHVSLSTTQVYVRGLDVEQLRAAMEGRQYGGDAA